MESAQIEDLTLRQLPFFRARPTIDGVHTEGTSSCVQGHRINRGDGSLPDGVYLEWGWDGHEFVARNDRYGLYPLFYSSHNGELHASPAIEHVLDGNAPRDLNLPALSVFFRLGHFIGNDTPFEQIRMLPPNTVLRWKDGELSLEHPRDDLSKTSVDGTALSFDEAVDAYGELFSEAIRRRLPTGSSFTVPISGGRDSRHILLALDAEGIRPDWCPTLEYRPPCTNEDFRIAALLTDALSIKHVRINRPSDWYQAVRQDVHVTNFCGGGHAWILPLASHLVRSCDTVYDGLAGDVLSGGHQATREKHALMVQKDFRTLASLILNDANREGFISSVMAKHISQQIPLDLALDALSEELQMHADAPNPVQSFVFWNRTRRAIASIPFSVMSGVKTVHCPYLDHQIFDLLTTIDPDFLYDVRLHDAVISRTYKKFANIPYENKAASPITRREDKGYYRASIGTLIRAVLQRRSIGGRWVRPGAILPRALSDLLKPDPPPPWYLMSTVYCLELESRIRR